MARGVAAANAAKAAAVTMSGLANAMLKPGFAYQMWWGSLMPISARWARSSYVEAIRSQVDGVAPIPIATATGRSIGRKPMSSDTGLESVQHEPVEITSGMLVALDIYTPSADGRSAVRIEEEILRHR